MHFIIFFYGFCYVIRIFLSLRTSFKGENVWLIQKPVKNNKIISSVLVDGIKLQLSIERATPAQARQNIFNLSGETINVSHIVPHSVLERIWIKGSYLSQWLPQGERGPPKESKSLWIEILHIGSQFT